MSQSLSNILVHIIFSTKERYSFLTDLDLRSQLHAYVAGTLMKGELSGNSCGWCCRPRPHFVPTRADVLCGGAGEKD